MNNVYFLSLIHISILYQEFLKGANLTIVEQTPLNGSKVSLLISPFG